MILAGFFFSSFLYSSPTFTGTKGLNYVVSAESERKGHLNYIFSLYGYGNESKEQAWHGVANVNVGLGFSFTDYLSFNVTTSYLGDKSAERISYGFGDTKLYLKFTPTTLAKVVSGSPPTFLYYVDFGIEPFVSFPPTRGRPTIPSTKSDTILGFVYIFNHGGINRYFTDKNLHYGGRGLLTLRFGGDVPLVFHLNGGYIAHSQKNTGVDEYTYGVGLELNYPGFTPFVEVVGKHRVDVDSDDYNDGAIYLNPCLRFETDKNSWFTIGFGLNLHNFSNIDTIVSEYCIQTGWGTNPDWVINIGFSRGFDFVRPLLKKGTVAGRVVDKKTKVGLRALISFPELDTVVATDSDGYYSIDILPIKTIVHASKEGYEVAGDMTIEVREEEKTLCNFELMEKRQAMATLTGKVTNKITGKPLIALISFPESNLSDIKSSASGVYRVDITPGTYLLSIKREGYLPQTKTVVCGDGETQVIDIEIVPAKRRCIVTGKVLDYTTKKRLDAEVSFEPASGEEKVKPVRTDKEIGIYKASIPPGTYIVKADAEGYIPEAEPLVFEPEKTYVYDFTLLKKGEKIILKGIYFDSGKATIKPESYSALDNAVKLLKEHPNVKVEIAGHTDSVGKDSYNLELSQRRANAVLLYLVESGISRDRLRARGYGETSPIASNRTSVGQTKNRRIEFQILEE